MQSPRSQLRALAQMLRFIRPGYEVARIVLAAAFALGLVWFSELLQDDKDRAQAIASTVQRNENLAIALEEFTERTVQSADGVARLLKTGAEQGTAQSSLEHIVASGILDKNLFQGAGVLDEFGAVVASTQQPRPPKENYADRAYFRAHAQADTGTVLVAQPVVSRRTGEPSIPITRRINKPDGSFGGVAVVQLSPQRFSELYKSANLVGDDFIAVIGLDGVIRVRRTGTTETSGEDYSRSRLFQDQARQSSDSVKGPGLVDGVERYVSYRTMADYKLIAVVGVTEARALSGYLQQRKTNIAIAAGVSGIIILFSLVSLLFLRRRARDAYKLRASEERLHLAMDAGNMAAWEYPSRELSNGPQRGASHILGLAWVHTDDCLMIEEFIRTLGPDTRSIEFRGRRSCEDERWFGLQARRVDAHAQAGVLFDVTERKTAEIELQRLANHDTLTGLPNRALFHRRFEAALDEASHAATSVYLMVVDLDDFKDVNDALGHDAGDDLLKQVAYRIEQSAAVGMVARLGGDEFGVLVTTARNTNEAVEFAEELRRLVCQPCSFGGRLVATRASIGLAAFPEHDKDIASLMKDADIALYRAKGEGRNRTVVFKKQMRDLLEARLALLKEIRTGLDAGQFVPFYQPKLCLRTLEVVGFEALARWCHPAHGLLTPAAFKVAWEDAELAEILGRTMVRTVAQDAADWMLAGLRFGRIAVNLSSAEFRNPNLADDVMAAWTSSGVPLANLEVEITETVFLDSDLDQATRTLARFREFGVHVALDDFGTGFASLTHLKKFDVDHIKIDQTFIRGLMDSPGDKAIVSAVIALGASFGMEVTAEGVELPEQETLLTSLGCDHAQGYLYAKPMAGSRVPHFLWSRAGRNRSNVARQALG